MDAILLGQKTSLRYPNPTRYFIFNLLINSFIFIKNKCFLMWSEIWKREKKSSSKGGFEPGSIASKGV